MSKVYISAFADNKIKDYLTGLGHEVIPVEKKADVDSAIECHPDIYMCHLGEKLFFGNPNMLSHDYPGDAIYNGCSTGKYFIHNLKITSPELLSAAKTAGLILVHVPQGYSKCNIVVVDEDSIITSDLGIYKKVREAGIEVLLVKKGQVHLEGYDYGFLGGSSGKVGKTILFNGDLSKHSDFETICRFIAERGIKIKYFEDYPLTDIGSVIEDPQ